MGLRQKIRDAFRELLEDEALRQRIRREVEEYLAEKFPDRFDAPPEPPQPDKDEPPPLGRFVDARREWDVQAIWSGPPEHTKVVGMASTPESWLLTVSDVYEGRRSAIYIGGHRRALPESSQETIGQPIAMGNTLYFPVEHGSHVIEYREGKFSFGMKVGSLGAWSVAGASFGGVPVMAFNARYGKDRKFKDRAKLVDVSTGRIIGELPNKAMARSMMAFKGKLWAACNFGDNSLVTLDGSGKTQSFESDVVSLAVHMGRLWAGGGARWGRSGKETDVNGGIYVFERGALQRRFETDSASVQFMAELDGELWVCAIDPDRLFKVDRDGVLHLVAEMPGETARDGARSFGAAVTLHDGTIYWARSGKTMPHVYTVERAGA